MHCACRIIRMQRRWGTMHVLAYGFLVVALNPDEVVSTVLWPASFAPITLTGGSSGSVGGGSSAEALNQSRMKIHSAPDIHTIITIYGRQHVVNSMMTHFRFGVGEKRQARSTRLRIWKIDCAASILQTNNKLKRALSFQILIAFVWPFTTSFTTFILVSPFKHKPTGNLVMSEFSPHTQISSCCVLGLKLYLCCNDVIWCYIYTG